MSTPIPPPLRAVAGLAAVAIDNARKLPEQLVGLPVLAVSAALQVSLKAQQRYAALVARGDEVLGQLRPDEEAPPWARFDDAPPVPGPAGRPPSAFDTVVVPDVDVAGEDALLDELAAEQSGALFDEQPGALLDELAAEQLGAGEPEATLLAEADLGAPVVEVDGVAATEAEVGGLDVAEIPLDDTDLPATDLAGGSDLTPGAGRAGGPGLAGGPGPAAGGAGTEPGVDMPGGQSADAAETGAALAAAAAGREPGSVGEPGVDLPTGLAADAEAVGDALAEGDPFAEDALAADPAAGDALAGDALAGDSGERAGDPEAGLDGYLAVEPPIPHYDELSIPQLRGRLRSLTERQLADLVAYERSTAARPPYLTMLENRLATVRAR